MTHTEERPPSPPSSEGTSRTARVGEAHQVIDMHALATALWRGKWFIILFTVVGLALGIQKMITFQPQYEASMVVSPMHGNSSTANISNPGVRGLARIAGLDQLFSRGGAATMFDRLRYALGSITLIRQLVEKDDIIRRTFSDSWDAEKGVWTRPTGRRFEVEQSVKSILHLPEWRPPSVESFAEFVRSAIEIKETEDAPFFRLIYRHSDPKKAAEFLRMMFFAADDFLREQDKSTALQKKSYIERQLKQVSLDDHRTLLLSFLAQEEQRLMLLRSSSPYSANIIEPVFVSSSPTSPNLLKDLGVIIATWLLVSIGIVIVFFLIKWG